MTLHNRSGQRIMGFDNAHEIEYGSKRMVAAKRTFDHWHYHEKDNGQPYFYQNAGKLLEDFWAQVEKKVNELKGDEY